MTMETYTVTHDSSPFTKEVRAYRREGAAEEYYERVFGTDDWGAVVFVGLDGEWTRHKVEVEVTIDVDASSGEPCEDPHAAAKERQEKAAAATEPPDHAWIEVDGHMWATDGSCMIRKDAPRPATMRQLGEHTHIKDWLGDVSKGAERQKPSPADARRVMLSSAHEHIGFFDPRFGPILEPNKVTGPRGCPLGPAEVRNMAGEVIAYVMPRNAEPGDGSIRADGSPA